MSFEDDDLEKGFQSPSSDTTNQQSDYNNLRHQAQPLANERQRRSRWVESFHKLERVVTGNRTEESSFISLNEVIKSGSQAEGGMQTTTKTTSTQKEERQWYFSPDSIGSVSGGGGSHGSAWPSTPLDDIQEDDAEKWGFSKGPQGSRVKKEETVHSTTTVAAGGETRTVSEEYRKTSTNSSGAAGARDDPELNAISPILGAHSLPSLYNLESIPRLPLPRSTPSGFGLPTQRAAAQSSEPGETEASTRIVVELSSDSTSDTGIGGLEAVVGEGETTQGSSYRLQVSLYNQSGTNLPISADEDHSTLEYIQVIETASFRQYSFNEDFDGEGGGAGLLHRSKTQLRRMLSARNKFLTARTRSFMKRLQREVDLEMQDPDAAWRPTASDQARMDSPVELDSMETMPAPFELTVSPINENWGQWGVRPQLSNAGGTFTRAQTLSRMCCALFGRNLPHELQPMCKVYMSQLDKRLTTSMKNYELQTPNTLNWHRPLQYLVGCLKVVAIKMDASLSIEKFVEDNFAYLTTLMREGPAAAAASDVNSQPPVNSKNQVSQEQDIRLAHEWMLFCLEAWTMLDMTAVCKNRHDLRLSDNFRKAPLKDTLESLLPRFQARYTQSTSASTAAAYSKSTQIFPREMTAQMLQDLGGMEFVWTDDITKHLTLDTKLNTVKIYSHVAFAYLHAEAGTESSLSKSGLSFYHHMLTEITSTYLLLFGHNDRSRRIFANIDTDNRSAGYFDLFAPQHAIPSTKPKALYTTLDDFPIFGDRILELRGLLRPKGLAGLWRDTRDTLQWYTFWAVVVIGGVSLLLGVGQMAVGGLQAWASLKALDTGPV
ncbi:hypothetical protein DFH27DRAFT_22492 [Peziza echinospora]|nr:hypothetical protein DFH27DRAFT_22492 [Peziza echinospora]